MSYPAAFWPGVLGISFLIIGFITYWRDFQTTSHDTLGFAAFGPVLVAASLAAFAGEHFTAAASLAQIVPKWMPARLLIAYFVGVAHLAAALSFTARRYVRWSALGVALMFALFVLLMDLPAALRRPETRIFWSLVARQATFAIGVPSTTPTAAWIPLPALIAYATGILLVAFGIAMFTEKYARAAAVRSGLLMTVLTVALYVPQWVMGRDAAQQVTGINFVFDTLLFAGMMFVVGRALDSRMTTG